MVKDQINRFDGKNQRQLQTGAGLFFGLPCGIHGKKWWNEMPCRNLPAKLAFLMIFAEGEGIFTAGARQECIQAYFCDGSAGWSAWIKGSGEVVADCDKIFTISRL